MIYADMRIESVAPYAPDHESSIQMVCRECGEIALMAGAETDLQTVLWAAQVHTIRKHVMAP
jgi:hypothetical protein